MIWVVKARYIDDFKVFVEFNNGVSATIDLESYIKSKQNMPIFEPLKHIENFKMAIYNQEIDTLSWPNGADIAPERLYELAIKANFLQ